MKSPGAAAFLRILFVLCLLGLRLYPVTPPRSETLRIGIDSYPVSLNPVYATNETSQAIVNKVFDGLFAFDREGNIREHLVEKFRILETHTPRNNKNIPAPGAAVEIILELKKGYYFPGGKELDAEDVAATFRLMRDNRYTYPYRSTLRFIDTLEKIDRNRLKIKLLHPAAAWKMNLTFKILNADELKAARPETFRNMNLSGTGPYKILEAPGRGKILLERSYTNHTAASARPGSEFRYLEYTVISDTLLSPLKLIGNEIDVCELQPESVTTWHQAGAEAWRESFRILRYEKYGYTYLVFNETNSLLTVDIKRIFYNLLVVGDFLERFLKGRGERVKSPFLPLSARVEVEPLPAKIPAKPIRLKIVCNSESKLRKGLVLFLRERVKAFNIDLQPIFLEYHSFLDALKKGRYDVAISGYTMNNDYDISDILTGDGYFNYARFRNPDMDALLAAGIREMDPRKREGIYLEAHRLWREHLPVLPLFSLYYYTGVAKRVQIPEHPYQVVGAAGDFLFDILDWKRK